MWWRAVRRVAAVVLVGLMALVLTGGAGIVGATGRFYDVADVLAAAHLGLSGWAWPWALTLRPIVLADVAVAAVMAVPSLLRRWGRRPSPGAGP